MFINYAHRGASAYAPENTMAAFRMGVAMGANGIETDIRRTRDGVPVLFHDESLLRLTGIDRKIADLTWAELSTIRIASQDGTVTDTVPRLAEFLEYVKDLPVALALEIKAEGMEAAVRQAIDRYGVADRCVVTAFEIGYLCRIKELDPTAKIGLLTREVNGVVLASLKEIGAEQICPKADLVTPELVRDLHNEGFSVRAWGVRDEAVMEKVLRCGVDGMTVNFPDKLRALLDREKPYALKSARRAPQFSKR